MCLFEFVRLESTLCCHDALTRTRQSVSSTSQGHLSVCTMSRPWVRHHSHQHLATAHGCVIHGSKGKSPFPPWTGLRTSRRHSHTNEVHRWCCLTGSGTHAPGGSGFWLRCNATPSPSASPSRHKQETPVDDHGMSTESSTTTQPREASTAPCGPGVPAATHRVAYPATVLNWSLRTTPGGIDQFPDFGTRPSVSVLRSNT